MSADLLYAFADAFNSHAGSRCFRGVVAIARDRHAAAVILNLETDFFPGNGYSNSCLLAAGVAMNVSEALPHNSEDGHLHVARQTSRAGRNLKLDADFCCARQNLPRTSAGPKADRLHRATADEVDTRRCRNSLESGSTRSMLCRIPLAKSAFSLCASASKGARPTVDHTDSDRSRCIQ